MCEQFEAIGSSVLILGPGTFRINYCGYFKVWTFFWCYLLLIVYLFFFFSSVGRQPLLILSSNNNRNYG